MSLPPFEKKPIQIAMTLDDPQKASIMGVKTKPKIVNAFYEATELDKKGDHRGAEKIYLELLNADFDNPVLHAALGMCYASQERNGLAYTLLDRARSGLNGIVDGFKRLGVTPKSENDTILKEFLTIKHSEILNALGTCFKHENKVPEARSLFEEAQSLIPVNPDIQNNLGTLYINEGRPDKALEHLNLALSINSQHPQARWNKSLAHLEMGDYEEGWKHYDAGIDAKVRMERNYAMTQLPAWDGSPGKNVVVYGEQGIGDEILFASCLPDLIKVSKSVVLDSHKRLQNLFSLAFPDIPIYGTREDEHITWPMLPNGQPRYNFDARIAIGSLPKFFRPTLESFPGTPYIKPPVEKEAEWTALFHKMGPKPKIGISWIGGHKRTRVEVRSCHLEQLLPILQQDADFISLQYTHCEQEIAEFETKHGIKIHQFPETVYAQDYAETAALVANLDLVITVCTSMVHLAGSMGVPTWVLTPSRPAWRYRLDLDYLPWYGKTVTLFRQAPDSTDWAPVVEEVSNNLKEMLNVLP